MNTETIMQEAMKLVNVQADAIYRAVSVEAAHSFYAHSRGVIQLAKAIAPGEAVENLEEQLANVYREKISFFNRK